MAEQLPIDKGAPSVLVPLKLEPGDEPLYLIHPLGGTLMGYGALVNELNGPVYGLRSLGLEPGEEPLSDLDQMAEHYAQLIQQNCVGNTCCLGGGLWVVSSH